MSNDPNSTINPAQRIIFTFLQLEKEVRAAKDIRSLAFIISNLSKRLLPYTQAIVWQKKSLGIDITAVSATSAINKKSPYIVWLQKVFVPWILVVSDHKEDHREVIILNKKNLPQKNLTASMISDWETYLADNVMLCHFKNLITSDIEAGVIFINEGTVWTEAQVQLANELRQLYEHAWYALTTRTQKSWQKIELANVWNMPNRQPIILICFLLVIIVLLIPVRQTVLASAKVAPENPILVTPSLEGIIQSVNVEPNQTVRKNQILFVLDKITLENKYQQAQKALVVAEEKYRRAYQDAYNNPKSKEELSVLQEGVEKAKNELTYAKELLERSDIRAPSDIPSFK